jgi:adenosylmethionine-8-amino-7-oxononanoate aminotransferase
MPIARVVGLLRCPDGCAQILEGSFGLAIKTEKPKSTELGFPDAHDRSSMAAHRLTEWAKDHGLIVREFRDWCYAKPVFVKTEPHRCAECDSLVREGWRQPTA